MELFWTLVCMALITKTGCDSSKDDVELWLEDYTRAKDADGNMQSDSPQDKDDDEEYLLKECPQVSDKYHSTMACLLPKCNSDTECLWPTEKCCDNGCLNTCLKALPPPPFIDWRREPQRNPLTGISWLIEDEDDQADQVSAQIQTKECYVDHKTYKDGQQFVHHRHKCKCHKGLVDCVVSA